MKTFANCVGKSSAIVFQAGGSGNAKGNEDGGLRPSRRFANVMEALPMITPKCLTGGMEFLITVGLSAVAGLLAFLLVSLVVNILGLAAG
jgi:hypothetical protein